MYILRLPFLNFLPGLLCIAELTFFTKLGESSDPSVSNINIVQQTGNTDTKVWTK